MVSFEEGPQRDSGKQLGNYMNAKDTQGAPINSKESQVNQSNIINMYFPPRDTFSRGLLGF